MSRQKEDSIALEKARKFQALEVKEAQEQIAQINNESDLEKILFVEKEASEFFGGRAFTTRKRRYKNGNIYYDVRTYELERDQDGVLKPINFIMIGSINNDYGYGEVLLNDRFLRFNPQFEHLKLIRRTAGYFIKLPISKDGEYQEKELAPREHIAQVESKLKGQKALSDGARKRDILVLPNQLSTQKASALPKIFRAIQKQEHIPLKEDIKASKVHINTVEQRGIDFSMQAIGCIRTPYADKFAVPRQPGLTPDVYSSIEFYPPFSDPQAFIGLEGFSHIHVLFVFDQIKYDKDYFRAMIRPPRLGGNAKVGVFASRSPFRPNRIGLSILELKGIENKNGKVILKVSGADMVDGTPILDIKPYIPFVDAIRAPKGGFASEKPKLKKVYFKPAVKTQIKKFNLDSKALKQILSQDPRPAYKAYNEEQKERIYHANLMGYHIAFKVKDDMVEVEAIKELNPFSL